MFLNRKKIYTIIVLLGGFIALPLFVFAQAHVTISSVLPGSLATTPSGSSPGAYIKNFYSYALFLSGLLAFGAIVYGGIQYAIARGNPSGESEAKAWITSALFGMLLLAGAYLILFTINPNLVNLSLPSLPAGSLPAGGYGGGGGGGGAGGAGGSGGGLSQAEAQRQLNGVGIGAVSSGGCTDPTRSDCTSFEGMQQSTVTELIDFKRNCGCVVTITGGTEAGHSTGVESHSNGYKADIQVNPTVDNYIRSNFTFVGNRSSDGAPQYRDSNGAVYARESNHWDMTAPGGH